MVSIPDEVKALFSSDTVHKNFHVTFPNGETTDLNNEDVISESVRFTESLCSQQYFKFGLAEASQIEFTAVGIPNVRGAYIECGIEIDCTRLGDAWAAAHPVDGTLAFLTPQTCNYDSKLYYRVPYGRFRIDTCPRNHGAMWQRQITAYSETLNAENNKVTFETIKENTLIPEGTYTPNIYKLFAALCNNKAIFDRAEWTASTVSYQSTPTVSKTVNVYLTGDATAHSLEVNNYVNRYNLGRSIDDIYTVDTDRDVEAEKETIYDYILNDMGIDWETTLTAAGFDTEAEFIADLLENALFYPTVNYSLYRGGTTYSSVVIVSGCSMDDVMYVKIGNEKTNLGIHRIDLPIGNYSIWLDSSPAQTYNYTSDTTDLILHTLDGANVFSGITMTFKSTLTQNVYYSVLSKTLKSYSFANAFSMIDYIIGVLELYGWFLKPGRDGNLDFFQMSLNPSPVTVPASDWAEFWWDETPVESIGTVNVIYTEENEEQQQTFTIGSGNSVYTIENNAALTAANMDETTMESVLTTYFAPNASVVNFTPVEMTMRGLPYLESGDYIEMTAEDGTTVDTYILSQTISGIQHLRADITSTNGNLLEVVES